MRIALNGIAVILSLKNSSSQISETKNPGLDELMKSIEKATENGVNYMIYPKESIKLEDFFPIDLDHKYFYYNVKTLHI